MDLPARYLLFNASVVLLIGLLCGVPYGMAITQKKSENTVRAWKLAHGALSVGAATMIAVAGILSFLQVNQSIQWLLSAAFMVSGYGFCFALTLEPFTNDRCLSCTVTFLHITVFVCNVIGSVSSLLGSVVLVFASFVSI
ncbi:MAG: hypothetical protein ACFB16_18280 [Phormidesmis sp.]